MESIGMFFRNSNFFQKLHFFVPSFSMLCQVSVFAKSFRDIFLVFVFFL